MRGGLRAIGIAPLALFGVYLVFALSEHRAADALWMCHLSNLLLGCALLLNRPTLARIAAIWIVFGIPLWLLDVWTTREITPPSVFSHLVGLAIALYTLAAIRMSENPWVYGILLYLAAQQFCRWFTDPRLNVNIAHRVYEGFEPLFGRYDVYWLTTTVLAAFSLWAIGRVLILAFPPPAGEPGGHHAGNVVG